MFNDVMHRQLFTNGWTKTFSQFYPTFEKFKSDYESDLVSGGIMIIPLQNADDKMLKHIYLILMGQYANTNVANFNEDEFLMQFWTRIAQYAPQYERELKIQESLLKLTDEEIQKSAEVIYNSALNPSQALTEGINATDGKLNTINQQNTTQHKRSKLDAYDYLNSLLNTNLTKQFIQRFRDLFTVVKLGVPFYYETLINNGEEDNV